MRALILEPSGGVRLDANHREPTPKPDEVLVHVRQAGICATDLELVRGYASAGARSNNNDKFVGILGHEFVGEVDRSDAQLGGRRVVADINIGCGRCAICRANDPHHCRARTTIGIRDRPGVFADLVAIPRANLITIPDSVDDDLAVFAEPLAAALHVLDEADTQADPSSPITVLGDGKLGLLIALAIHAAGHEVELVGRHPQKLEIAKHSGIPTLLDGDLGDRAEPRTSLIVEATGSPNGLARAMQLVRPRGTIVIKTTTAAASLVDLTPIVVNELRLIGSRCGDMRRAVDLLATGRLDPRPLISARYSLDDAAQALVHAASPLQGQGGERSVLKVLLRV